VVISRPRPACRAPTEVVSVAKGILSPSVSYWSENKNHHSRAHSRRKRKLLNPFRDGRIPDYQFGPFLCLAGYRSCDLLFL
jgi:hypothetical protein